MIKLIAIISLFASIMSPTGDNNVEMSNRASTIQTVKEFIYEVNENKKYRDLYMEQIPLSPVGNYGLE